MAETAETVDSRLDALTARLERIEHRLEELETRKADAVESGRSAARARADERDAEAAPLAATMPEDTELPPVEFDLALVGRTLIVLGGAYLLRAITEAGVVPVAAGLGLGLVYAVAWSLIALRPNVERPSAAYHGFATLLASFPLIWEATKKFEIFGEWSSAFVLAGVSALLMFVAWRRRLNSLAWGVTLLAMALSVLLMLHTKSPAPFTLYLLALGIVTLWMGYELDWHMIRWPVAFEIDVVLVMVAFLFVTGRDVHMSPAVAIAISSGAFAAYLVNFAIRTIVRQRDIVPFEIVQTLACLVAGLGGAVWVATYKQTLEVPLAIATLAIAAASYAVSFAFIPKNFSTINFTFYSSLALVLTLAGGSFIVHGLPSSVLWAAITVASAYFASRFSKTSLAYHCATYVFAGYVTADLFRLGLASLFLTAESPWPLPGAGALLIVAACVFAVGLRPIARNGGYEGWIWAKLFIMAELGWGGATLVMALLGVTVIDGLALDPAVVAVIRTALLSGLTIAAAWSARYPLFIPGRMLGSAMMVVLAMKLMWDDFRAGRPSTLFLSLALVGAALILAPALRRKAASLPSAQPAATEG